MKILIIGKIGNCEIVKEIFNNSISLENYVAEDCISIINYAPRLAKPIEFEIPLQVSSHPRNFTEFPSLRKNYKPEICFLRYAQGRFKLK